MPRFCLVQDLADFLQVTIAADDPSALAAIDEATAVIQNYTHQDIELVVDDVVTLDVRRGQRRIFLPQVPVLSVASVVEDDDALVVTDDYKLGGNVLYRVDRDWLPGDQILTVTYTHGYALNYDLDGFPEDLRNICKRMAARSYQAGRQAAETGAVPGVSGTTIGDYQVSYSATALVGPSGSLLGASAAPLVLRSEMALLDRYRYRLLV